MELGFVRGCRERALRLVAMMVKLIVLIVLQVDRVCFACQVEKYMKSFRQHKKDARKRMTMSRHSFNLDSHFSLVSLIASRYLTCGTWYLMQRSANKASMMTLQCIYRAISYVQLKDMKDRGLTVGSIASESSLHSEGA